MKQRIRLTESQFHNIVKECVKNILSESANPIEKVQSLIDAANSAYAEASKHTQDKWCLMDKEGNAYGLESPIALKRGYVIINYDDPYHTYADNQIRVLTRQNGKDVLFNGDYYDEGWKDAKRELNRIIKDAERGKQHFEGYNPNWENPESKEEYTQSKSDMRNFNKSIGLQANTGVDNIERRFLKENEGRYILNCYIPGKGNYSRTAIELKALKPYIEQASYWDITTGWNSSEPENLVAWGGKGGYWDNYINKPDWAKEGVQWIKPSDRDIQLVMSKKKD